MSQYSWIPIYKEISKHLKKYYNNRQEIIQLLKKMKDGGLTIISLEDKNEFESYTLKNIDPFTFYSNFNRGITDDNRIKIIEYIKEEWSLKENIPDDFSGIPVMNNQKSWFFPYEKERNKDDIEYLWKLFLEALENNINEETFNNVLNIRGIKNNITMALFWINPELYLNIDSVNIKYLNEYDIDTSFVDFESYFEIINQVKNKIKKPFYQISYDAWKSKQEALSETHKKKVEKDKKTGIRFWIYAPGTNAKHWDICLKNNIMLFGADELPNLKNFSTREEIIEELKKINNSDKSFKNSSLSCWNFANEIKKNDIIIAKKGSKIYLGYGVVNGEYSYDKSRKTYRNVIPVKWKKTGEWIEEKGLIVQKTLTDITIYSDYVRRLKNLIGIELAESDIPKYEIDEPSALNIILYGPPGTGKTYKIQNEYMKYFTDIKEAKTKKEFIYEITENFSWFKAITFALLDMGESKVPDLAKHPVLKTKSEMSNTKFSNAAIWAHLQAHTKDDCENVKYSRKQEPLIFWKNEKSFWTLDKQIVEENMPEMIELWEKYNNYTPEERLDKRYSFITFHQSFSYEDFIEGIKPIIEEEEQQSDVQYRIEDGVFKKIAKRALLNPDKSYALFIDEINRGNIAEIFGELITLIEDDKRKDKENELYSDLPYSKEPFSVPGNLFIIGSMNTADRSIEALDTALRRRFTFIDLYPDPELLNDEEFICEGIDLSLMLQAINDRIEILLDKDHCIGHSYFMTIEHKDKPLSELQSIFKDKIIPLLQEYFYSDYSKIKMILGTKFIIEEEKKYKLFISETDEYNDYNENKIYYKITIPDTLEDFKSIYEI